MQQDTILIEEVIVRSRMEMHRISGDTVLYFPRSAKTLKGDSPVSVILHSIGIEPHSPRDMTLIISGRT